jgi:hypothetical protein
LIRFGKLSMMQEHISDVILSQAFISARYRASTDV